jgi:hypothetical protein
MPTIPTPLIILPLLVSMVTFILRFYRLNPEENTRNPNFVAATACMLLILAYMFGVQVIMGGSTLASLVFFVAAMVMALAAIRAMLRMRGRV